ncbi:MAG: PIN domain-containing protein [Chloroflexota bacterium]
MRVLLDTNVVLDLYLDRIPFADAAAALWQAHEQGDLVGYVSSITPVNIYYIAQKLKDERTARQAVIELLSTLRVCPTDQLVLSAAIELPIRDYEDAVQIACAMSMSLDAIVTRNLDDYASSPIPVYAPTDFLQKYLPDA